ncbi:related to VPS36 protein, involved in vacuolar protein sorting [Phialocephala subalpina]|uniref:Vacuolar protein-sorting-associated protein 36 n=1 Tax=Phialocephala subalpina TaxID=576137 RepID=A0A1L7XRU6_9HELO|nr:related to VPS36 protein, involved in vacuolar protein sorting [Phialocephala subalpina]
MFLKHIDLTTALRPLNLPDEVILFVQDNVGLYEGKYKIPNHQNGSVYLTTHRICYVDNEDPRKNSAAIDLKEVERYEFYAGFLKSSAKITLYQKPDKRSSIQNRAVSNLTQAQYSRSATSSPSPRAGSPFHLPTPETVPVSTGTWICPICSFSNPVPPTFDWQTASERTPLDPCGTCGVKPPYALVMKAAIASASSRPAQPSTAPLPAPIPVRGHPDQPRPQSDTWPSSSSQGTNVQTGARTSIQCPRCTFLNHPSLTSCELCHTSLISQDTPTGLEIPTIRQESPGPVLSTMALPGAENNATIKISFRNGGEKIFYERLKSSITQRKWVLHRAPPVPTKEDITVHATPPPVKNVGIARLEQKRLEVQKNNELVIGNAFEDLQALMESAQEIIALAESFASKNGAGGGSDSNAVASALGLVTTKDMLGGGSNSESLYISELSRNLAEFLTDDARGILRKAGGIISLVDLWAVFNRARGGVELVSPLDFEKAARLWEKLKLPVRLRQFKSGVLVVQASDRTDEKTIKALLAWLGDLHIFPPDKEVPWDWQYFGRGVTAQDAAERFGWSIGVAEEELEMAEEKEVLCREESIEGLKFWINSILHERPEDGPKWNGP